MSKITIRTILFILSLFPSLAGAGLEVCAQLRLSVDAPAEVGEEDEYFTVRYEIASARAGSFNMGKQADFEILSPPSTSVSSSTSIINGRMQSNESTTYTIVLKPTKQGRFTISPASVSVGNKTYRSEPATITVKEGRVQTQTPAGGSGRNGASQVPEELRPAGSAVSEKDLFVTATLSRDTVYEQESVPLTYHFYAKLGIGLNQIGLNQKPDFKGIVSQELDSRHIQPSLTRLGDETFRTGVVQQYVLFPQTTGVITVPPLTFQCIVLQRDAEMDLIDAFFNGGGHISRELRRSTKATRLVVKPLPAPRPTGFSGGVGQLSVTAKLLSPTVRTDEMTTYRITVAGTGNLKLLIPPVITFPTDFETYAPKTTDNTELTAEGVKGSVSFDYTFVPRNTGNYTIPALSFIYFDPAAEDYVTVEIPAQSFAVQKSIRSAEDIARDEELRNSDIRNIVTGEARTTARDADYYWWGKWTYWAVYPLLLLVAVMTVLLVSRYRRATADAVRVRRSKAAKVAKRRLKQAATQLRENRTDEFYTELVRALQSYLSDKMDLPAAELNRDRIQVELLRRGVDEAHISALQSLLDDCAYVRFAPAATSGQADDFYNRAAAVISALESGKRQLPPSSSQEYTL